VRQIRHGFLAPVIDLVIKIYHTHLRNILQQYHNAFTYDFKVHIYSEIVIIVIRHDIGRPFILS